MIQAPSRLHDNPKSRSAFFGALLKGLYDDMLDHGIPEPLASLVQQIERPGELGARHRLALVVDADPDARSLAAALLEQTELSVVECASGEAALAVLQHDSHQVAFVFADEHLEGARGGLELARAISTLWPGISVVVTADVPPSAPDLPSDVLVMQKPWLGLEVLIAAERAAQSSKCGGLGSP